jgi:amino acid adenylation domain-containing protein
MQINILEYFEQGSLRHCPDKAAIVDQDRSYTFRDVERYSKRCATLLLRRGDFINQPVAVYLPKSASVVFADLGVLYSGNIYLNLDTKWPARRNRMILANTAPAVVITSRECAASLDDAGVPPEKRLFIEEIFSGVEYDSAALWQRLERVIDTDPLCIVNTSGSTGVPKSPALSHRGTIDFMDWCFERLRLDGSERIGSLSPFHFDIYTLELNLSLAKGATIVIIPEQLAIFPARLMEFLSRHAISFIFWVPTIMVNISNRDLLGQFDLSALKTVFFAGEVFPMKHLNRWRRALSGARFVNLYGPIEITVDCTYFVLDRDFRDDDSLPIGFPCRNTDILILGENNQPCATGEHGELCVRGSSLAMGYWNDPENTAKAFVQNPLNTRYPELIYRTGDVVYRNERGEIMYVGRKDFQIKHMGYRIELAEIEHQVLAIEQIANACVLYNSGKKEITLFYETKSGDLSPAAIRQALAQVFPKYMLPTVFHQLAELPRNPNGKIDRNGLSVKLEQRHLSEHS